ncbi:MAG: lipoyl(octanoyl) transferase LipB [Magnetococcales bacterium]|nr:lipoyl(octanoyl) transferase LipB [Magnetococcales bacterium]
MPFRLIRHRRQAYGDSLEEQQRIVAGILAGREPNRLILTEHEPVYTLGRSAAPGEVIDTRPGGAPVAVFETDRGGRVTYHGPGQLVAYVLMDLHPNPRDVRGHVWRLEESAIRTLAGFGIDAGRDAAGPGIWVNGAKIGALGVRIRRGVTSHGLAINRDPTLDHFAGIVPCGFRNLRVTSLAALGIGVDRETFEAAYLEAFQAVFQARIEAEETPS